MRIFDTLLFGERETRRMGTPLNSAATNKVRTYGGFTVWFKVCAHELYAMCACIDRVDVVLILCLLSIAPCSVSRVDGKLEKVGAAIRVEVYIALI